MAEADCHSEVSLYRCPCPLRIVLETKGTVDMDHVSLFPVKTWKGRENGLRADLAQALYDLNPGVLRFPGGCIIEGNSLATRYQWKIR